jgi:integrase
MRVFRTTYKDRKGRTREAAKWYVEWTDHRDTVRRLPGFPSKAATEELGRNLERLTAYHRATGGQTDPALWRWLTELPPSIRAGLVRLGLLSSERVAANKPLSEHLKEFEAGLRTKGATAKHAALVSSRAKRLIDGCKFGHMGQVSGSRVLAHLADLRKDTLDKDGKVVKRGLGAQTCNHYVGALTQLCRWMVKERRASENPIAHLERWNVRTDRRHDRRALSVTDVRALLKAAESGPVRCGMTGTARALLYRLAVESGLRAGELRSLRRGSLHLGKEPTLTIEAAYAKNRRRDTLPLREDTAAALGAFTATLAPAAPVFTLPHPDTMSDMLQADLAEAGIPYVLDGLFADMHALRHTCGSWLAASGAHPKVIQRVLRHSTITLSMDRYTHLFKGDEAAAMAKMPHLGASGPERARATGTDGAVLADCLAQTGGVQGSGVGAGGPTGPTLTHGDTGKNSAENAGFSLKLAGNEAKPPVGFEPTTCGLQNRCSTAELRWRQPAMVGISDGREQRRGRRVQPGAGWGRVRDRCAIRPGRAPIRLHSRPSLFRA